jgi:hypothetical protein
MGRVLRQAERLKASPGIRLVDEWWLRHTGNDSRLTKEEQYAVATATAGFLELSHVLWALWPETVSHGTAWEVGYFRHLCPPNRIVVTGRTSHECPFTAYADLRDTSDDIGFHEVLRILREFQQ